MQKNYKKLQKELLYKKKGLQIAKNRISSLKIELLKSHNYIKTLIYQYERIIIEWKKMYKNLIENGWKIMLVKIIEKYNNIKGGE